MLIYNIDYEVAGILISLLLLIFISFQYSESESTKRFRNAIMCNILASTCDAWTVFFYSFPDTKYLWANYLVNSLCFYFGAATSCAILYYLIGYLNDKKETPSYLIWKKINRIVLILFAILMIVNLFEPLIFTFDKNANYQRVGIYPIVYAIPTFYLFVFTFILFKERKLLSVKQIITLGSFALFTLIGMGLQFFVFPDTFLSYFASSIAILCMSFSLETPDYQKLTRTLEELSIAKEAAEKATLAKDSFLANMSHEIRTPLNSILGMDEMILRDSKEPKIKYYAADIKRAGNTLLSIINDILDVSKIESGNMELVEEDYSTAALIGDVVTITKLKAEKKDLEYKLDVAGEIPVTLYGDYVRIRQIMVNIIDNAIKYTQSGNIHITIDCNLRRRHMDEFADLTIRVEDTGIGIKQEDMDKLFQSFKRLDEKKNHKVEGTGLGLTLTKKLIEMLGGTIEVESEYGVGSTFSIYLSQKIINKTPIGDIKEAISKDLDSTKAYVATMAAPKARVLYVDDNEMNLDVFVNLMEPCLVKIDLAMSGKEALIRCKEKKYDMIFLDQMMPEMDGAETYHKLKELNLIGDTPVVALTADAIVGAREFYISNGFDEYLAKPIKYMDVEKVMYKLLPSDLIEEIKNEEGDITDKEIKPELLVIDESSEVLKAHRQKLDGYKVRLVRSNEEALKYMEKHSPEYVLVRSSEYKNNENA